MLDAIRSSSFLLPLLLFLLDISPARISEAFGSGKCPKLVEQCKSDNVEVRQQALAVLCEELRNPFSVVDCFLNPKLPGLRAIYCLSENLHQNDLLSRVRSAEVLRHLHSLFFMQLK